MIIRQVTIENFKRFETLTIDLGRLDCLVGSNNSGKTTLLQALALFDFCVHHCLSSRNGGPIEAKRRTIAPEDFYVLPIASPVDLWTDRKTQAENKHKIIRIIVTFDNDNRVTASVDLNYNRFAVAVETADVSQEWLRALRQFRIAYLPVFSMFLPQEQRMTPVIVDDAVARGRVNSVIRNLLLNLKDGQRDGELVEILRRVFPSLERISIEFDEASDRYISFTYREQGRPREFDVFSAGSGFQQFVYLFGFILLQQPTVILLDEPDVHLHGSLQGALLDELRHLTQADKQVLFATHSRDLIARMNPENVLTLEEGSAKRLAVAFDIYDALSRIGSVELTQLPVIQAYRRVIVVEDRSDWDLMSILCATCLGSAVWQQVERRLAVCYAKGNPLKQRDMPRLRQQLQQMVTLTGQPLKMFVIADRDYYPDLDYLRLSVQSEHIEWCVWERVEIENYLLCERCIMRLLRETASQSNLDAFAFANEFAHLVESSRENANDKLVKAFQEYGKQRAEPWDVATLSQKAREYLRQHWESDKLGLADAKDVVLPGIKRWLQSQGLKQFSDKALAEALTPADLPAEVHGLAQRLALFAGVKQELGNG